jgi:hypothetical protein
MLFLAAKPDRGLICTSKFSEKAIDKPVGIKKEVLGLIVTEDFMKAIKSIPDAPDVLYDGNLTSGDNFLINTLTINLIDY